MKQLFSIIALLSILNLTVAQDLSYGLKVNDLSPRLMQPLAKPGYLKTATDPSFGTTIRRISNASSGEVIKPMYSTTQAWNADESLMILYKVGGGHQLLNGKTYKFIRNLNDIRPDDLEQIFWDFNNPDIFYYLDKNTNEFIRYSVSSSNKKSIVDLDTKVTNCSGSFSMGNDVQMMSWDSDVFCFRCNNEKAYYYRISSKKLVEFNIDDIGYTAPMPGPSGQYFYHKTKVYNAQGNLHVSLNESSTEHSCIGKLSNGKDGHFAIAFAQGPNGGCIGDVVAHNMQSGDCYTLTSEDQGYDYSQSGTHISALSHKNTQGGWLAASMVGFQQDGQSLLDQELIVARANQGNIQVCRIGHHRSDEDQFDYWGEPHAVISPTGTRVLFASDWSGSADGKSVDSYVVELPSYNQEVEPPNPEPPNPEPPNPEPPNPEDYDNTIDWNSAPTSIVAGTNQISVTYSIQKEGFVVIQLFNSNWDQIGQEYLSVDSPVENKKTTFSLKPTETPSAINYLQAKLFNSDWSEIEKIRKQVEVKFSNNPIEPPTEPTGNSIDWNTTPTSITSGSNLISVKYSIDQAGLVVVQLFNSSWGQIGQEFMHVEKGSNQTATLALKPNQTPTAVNYLQAKLLKPSWEAIKENNEQVYKEIEVTSNSNGKLKNEELNKLSILPNPFNNQTLLNYQVEKSGKVSISIHSADGKEVKELENNKHYEAGMHQLHFDGVQLSPGVYFIHFTYGNQATTKKLYKY